MSSFVIDNVTALFPDRAAPDSAVKVGDGAILEIGRRGSLTADDVIDGEGLYLAPGFMDIHVHGGGGGDFMDADDGSFRAALTAHMKHGTTSIVPTTTCTDEAELERFFDSAGRFIASPEAAGLPHVLGFHLEGPFISPGQAGAQDPKYVVPPEEGLWRRIVDGARGLIRIWTVAPELPGACEMCRELGGEGIVFSAGHSDAAYDDAVRAIEAGYTMATHLYSSMSTIVRRNGYRVPGLLEAAMLHDELCCEVIADGKHLPAPLLKLIYKTKGPDRIVLVTDAMRGAGMPDGDYILGSRSQGQLVSVFDGIAHMPDGVSFAGSVATADRLVRVMVKEAGVPLHEAVRMITKNPAREIGEAKKGEIAPGFDADLVLFDGDVNVKGVFISGRRVV